VSSEKFRRCLAFVLRFEGGYSNHPADKGGRTYKGISERAHPEAWKHGPPSDATVAKIYEISYWQAIHGEQLPEPLALAVMDFAVHSGPTMAWRMLAAIFGLPRDSKVTDVLERVRLGNAGQVAIELVVDRAVFLVRRALVTPGQDAFLIGWVSRMRELKRAVEAAADFQASIAREGE